jgi:hypothetical protein
MRAGAADVVQQRLNLIAALFPFQHAAAEGKQQRLAPAEPPTLKRIVLAKTLLRGMSSICGRARTAVVQGMWTTSRHLRIWLLGN